MEPSNKGRRPKRHNPTADDISTALSDYIRGVSIVDIAARLCVHEHALTSAAISNGWEAQRSKYQTDLASAILENAKATESQREDLKRKSAAQDHRVATKIACLVERVLDSTTDVDVRALKIAAEAAKNYQAVRRLALDQSTDKHETVSAYDKFIDHLERLAEETPGDTDPGVESDNGVDTACGTDADPKQ